MSMITHEGYVAEIDIDQDARLLSGIVLNTRATLHFTGGSVDELRQAFVDTIEDYRDWCKERGVEPEKPYSGTLSLRIAPELHRRVAEQAAKAGESINQFIAERLDHGSIVVPAKSKRGGAILRRNRTKGKRNAA